MEEMNTATIFAQWIGKRVLLDMVDFTLEGVLLGGDDHVYIIADKEETLLVNRRDVRVMMLKRDVPTTEE